MNAKDIDLAAEIAQYYSDPLQGCLFLYPWGKSGTPLADSKGPNREQARFLDDLGDEIKARRFNGRDAVPSIRMSVSSGHGTGKTSLIGMLAGFLMATRDAMRGTVTANTGDQLKTKTWASIQMYKKLLICAHWFDITSELFWRIGRKEDWFMQAATCREENADAFQGQHSKTSSSVYIFDEDSNVPDTIHTAAEGGTVHGEAMYFRFGNPTRREGSFYQTCFGTKLKVWLRHTLGPSRDTDHPAGFRRWDARYTEFRNDAQIAEWKEEYGEDSDFFRVRAAGLPPEASDLQFISSRLIHEAQLRPARALSDDPLVAGCDLAWGGNDSACVRFKRGLDMRTVKPIKVPGELLRDDSIMVLKLADVLDREWDVGAGRKMRVAMLFIDSAGACGPIVRRLREMGYKNILEINFGAHSPNKKYKLMRSYMWGQLKEALPQLAIDASPDLEADLSAPGYRITKDGEILLELKQDLIKRLGHSTDDGDSAALCFAAPVRSKQTQENRERKRSQQPSSVVSAWS